VVPQTRSSCDRLGVIIRARWPVDGHAAPDAEFVRPSWCDHPRAVARGRPRGASWVILHPAPAGGRGAGGWGKQFVPSFLYEHTEM